jgi:hypothetical protein
MEMHTTYLIATGFGVFCMAILILVSSGAVVFRHLEKLRGNSVENLRGFWYLAYTYQETQESSSVEIHIPLGSVSTLAGLQEEARKAWEENKKNIPCFQWENWKHARIEYSEELKLS